MEHQARRHIAKVFGNKRQNSPISLPAPTVTKTTQKPTSTTPPAAPPPTHTTTKSTPAPPKTPTSEAAPSTTSTSTSTTSTTSTTSSSSSTTSSSTTSSTSSTPISVPSISYNTPGLTSPNALLSATPTPSGDPSGNSANNSPAAGTIAGAIIGALFGVAALILIVGFIRRRMRKSARDRWNRDSFIRDSMMLPADTRPDSPPVVGTRNALALARQNLASEDGHTQRTNDYGYGASQPEMSFTPGSHLPAHYGASYGTNDGYYQGYDAYGNPVQQQPPQAAPGGYYDMYGAPAHQQYHDGYGQQQHGHGRDGQFDDIARAVDVPAVALHSPTTDGGRTSPHGSGRQLNATYGSTGQHQHHDMRSGTPTEANPQQAYLAPGDKHIAPTRDSVYSANDAYGGM